MRKPTLKENIDIEPLAQWVAALESGTFKQCQQVLTLYCDDPENATELDYMVGDPENWGDAPTCCLGLPLKINLCNTNMRTTSPAPMKACDIPDRWLEEFFTDLNYIGTGTNFFVHLNDDLNYSFEEIAQEIRNIIRDAGRNDEFERLVNNAATVYQN